MELYFPTELGEQLAFIGASATALLGLVILLLPGPVLRLAAFQVGDVRPEGYGSVRAAGAQYIALGVLPILLAQDWFYMALGIALGLGAGGRLVSFVFDRGLTLRNVLIFLLQVVLAAGPLAYVFGYV
ncbi:DUF4345 domain-containing protein [Neorhizobium lilium]|uniref:DUF4345 domain-containing protein n=1 Tax=Neorhizobium lilium TaxID=2503024 RepID=A0A3S3VF57_9HYPH|nr:DUF4345 domain-containing protein [Neorhizobium lilium]RWX75170.1 DUF4345 domain-containing protein [Neorhizobium lilium]